MPCLSLPELRGTEKVNQISCKPRAHSVTVSRCSVSASTPHLMARTKHKCHTAAIRVPFETIIETPRTYKEANEQSSMDK